MKNLSSNLIAIILMFFPFMMNAQTTHTVEVGPGMIYTPDELTIEEGDIVSWVSLGGTHDVNFNINSVSGESFGNPVEIVDASLPVQGAGEMGSITFNNAGTYNYDCSVGSHAAMGMVGSITVTPSQSTTVVDVVVNSENHTTLEAAVVAAGLVETLSGDGPFTVFAPTDAAFALLPEGLVAQLLEDPTGDLTTILTHHVHSGNVLSTDLTNGMMVPTLAGTELTVSLMNDMVQIDNANVSVADIETDNGVVHVIDAVLVPEEDESTTVVDVVVNSENHTTLEAAVVAAGLVETLSGDGPFTVFAPTDAAFALLPEGLVAQLLEDPTGDLTTILTHHVHSGNVLSTDLTNGMMVPTLAGTELTVSLMNGMVQIDNANVSVADIETDNGVVHVIDAVLVPEEDESTTVVDVVVNSENHTTLEAAVVAAGLVETLSGDGPFTVFAPTDAAFALLPEGLVAQLLEDPTGDLTTILTHHVHSGNVLSTDLTNGMMVPTLAGTELTVSLMNGMVQIDNANVSFADIETDNGVVHVIDAVLVPNDLNIDHENILLPQDNYLYSIDIMGRKINNVLYHQIIFDVYSSGKVVKRFITKN